MNVLYPYKVIIIWQLVCKLLGDVQVKNSSIKNVRYIEINRHIHGWLRAHSILFWFIENVKETFRNRFSLNFIVDVRQSVTLFRNIPIRQEKVLIFLLHRKKCMSMHSSVCTKNETSTVWISVTIRYSI